MTGFMGDTQFKYPYDTCARLVTDLFSDADDCSGGPGDDLWLSTPLASVV